MADKKEKATKKATKEDAKQKATLPPSGFKVARNCAFKVCFNSFDYHYRNFTVYIRWFIILEPCSSN